MLKLTDDQLRSLGRHKLPVDSVLDARGMRTSDWKIELKRQNKSLALVDSPCQKGHAARLRLSSGHCVECSPQGVAHWKRHQVPGFVYVAVSRKLRLVKIGIAQLASERADALIKDEYGGADDWQLIYRRKFDKAGWVEAKAQTSLAEYSSPRTYTRKHHGKSVTARELFSCDYSKAIGSVESLCEHALGDAWEPADLARIVARLEAP
ncbi:GIY-YIG nuclease family protein [Methyloceanibacter sp. wino2]|uniref:GIY-YIG nuclease family protein n=1 Tax=Methyloceanibacter sp. wino2 TaxID=2170729 RepID=UPI00131EEB42|nr:GIY-YIG nuclease family protein [Methyloceanibacter sp. wino2]